VGIGTTFKLYFPLVHLNTSNGTDEHTRRRPLDTNVSTLSGAETILVAEDIDETRELLTKSLRELGYGVLDARGGVEALELSRGYEGPIAVLVSDVVMPDLNGYELAHQLIRERPTTHVILTSGYAKDILGGDEFANANFTKVRKPYRLDDIAHLIRQLLDSK
jgi:CheY-like chemotaxis protein